MKKVILFVMLIWCVACVPTEKVQEGVSPIQDAPTSPLLSPTPLPMPTDIPTPVPSLFVDVVIEGIKNGKTKEALADELAKSDVAISYWSEIDEDVWVVGLGDPNTSVPVPGFESFVVADGVLQHYMDMGLKSIETIDFDEDNKPELLLNYYSCGVSSCYDTYNVIQKQPDGQYDLLSPLRDMAIESSDELMVTTFEGKKVFALRGAKIGSALAGIYRREYTIYWGLNSETNRFEEVGRVREEAVYRFGAMQDANDLFANGEYDSARSLYEKIVAEPNEYTDTGEQGVEDGSVQFSAFRLVLVNMILGDEADAQKWSQWLAKTHFGSMAADATPLLLISDDELTVKCQAVTDYLRQREEHEGEKAAGAIGDMGSHVPSITYTDFCPLPE